jgi:hypothetical protein
MIQPSITSTTNVVNEILSFSPIRNKHNMGLTKNTLENFNFRTSFKKENKKMTIMNDDDSIDTFAKEFSKLNTQKEKAKRNSVRSSFYTKINK